MSEHTIYRDVGPLGKARIWFELVDPDPGCGLQGGLFIDQIAFTEPLTQLAVHSLPGYTTRDKLIHAIGLDEVSRIEEAALDDARDEHQDEQAEMHDREEKF